MPSVSAPLKASACLPGLRGEGWEGRVPLSPRPFVWSSSRASGASFCSAVFLQVLVLVGSSGACRVLPAAPLMPRFPSSFSTSKDHINITQ